MKRVVIVATIVLLLDQLIKLWVKASFHCGEEMSLAPGFLQLHFVENPGMAFGMNFGGYTGKYILSIFRILAVGGIGYYIWLQTKKEKIHKGFLTALGLVFAGALGNIIDSAFYGYMFDVGTVYDFNNNDWDQWYPGVAQLNFDGYAGFLQGCVVDMFQFTTYWPDWMPWVGGTQIFGAIFNLADFAISVGVGLIILNQKKYFIKEQPIKKVDSSEVHG